MNKIKKGRVGAVSRYDAAFKRKVMEELFSGTITTTELRRKYNLGAGNLTRWQRWYEQDQADLLSSAAMNEATVPLADDQPQSNEEVTALRETLRLAQIKLVCLEQLIDLTEQDLGIDIRKKAGTRSSAT